MLGIGTTEALILLGVVVLLFGGRKLPQLGSAMGKALTNFKKGMKDHTPLEDDSQSESSEEEKNNHSA